MASPDILTVAADSKFQALPESDQHAILGHLDQNFAALPAEDKPHVIDTLQRHALSRPDLVAPPSIPHPQIEMRMSPLGKGYEGPGVRDIPGSFEGHPENIGEWPIAGPGQIGKGVKDIAQGKFARGGHEVLSGAGNTMMPFTPFIGTAAPLTTVRALAGGYIGGRAGEGAADVLKATPDQKALAGDVGNLVAGGVAAEPGPFIRGTGRVLTLRPRVALRTMGERMRNFGIEPPAAPPNPFRDVPEPGPPDVFNVQEPPKIARPSETPSPYRMRPREVPRDVIRPRGLLTSGEPQPGTIAAPEQPIRFSLGIPENPAPVRIGPGGVPPDLIGRPNARVLAGNQGVRTTPIGLLREPRLVQESAFMNPEIGLPSPRAELRPGMREAMEDAAIQDAMNADLEQHGAAARLEQGREFAARNSVGVPKWQRTAEARAQAILEEARQKAEERALTRELGRGMPKPVKAKPTIATPEAKPSGPPGISAGQQGKLPGVKVPSPEQPEDLTPVLEESLRRARLRRGK
jgi:hypothetical protein